MATKQKVEDFIGKKYNRLTVIGDGGVIRMATAVVCKCDCGKEVTCVLYSIKSGSTKSCGCYNTDRITKHGLRYHPLYKIWQDMKGRCTSPKYENYKDYGGRGIKVCDEWLNDPAAFINWGINNGYKKGLWVERKNNDGHYTPENSTFDTPKIQSRNRRSNVWVEHNGKKMIISDWAKEIGISEWLLADRLRRKWPIEKAMSNKKYSSGGNVIGYF